MKKSGNKSRISNNPAASGPQKAEGILVILSAPSGCGKTTLVDRLLRRHPDWVKSVSVTTRTPRAGEEKDKDYIFVSPREFQEMDSKGELLESAKVFNHWYGTPKGFVMDQLKQARKVFLAIDIQGTQRLKKILHKKVPLLTIFVLPPSVRVLRERLEGRQTESPEEIQHRIEIAQEEIKESARYDYTVVNQSLEQSVSTLEGFIEKFEKERRKN